MKHYEKHKKQAWRRPRLQEIENHKNNILKKHKCMYIMYVDCVCIIHECMQINKNKKIIKK